MEKNFYIRNAEEGDLVAIKDLQDQSLGKNLTPEQRAAGGFVSLETPLEDLEIIRQRIGIVAAFDDANQLLGYEIPLPLDMADRMPFLTPFIERAKQLDVDGEPLTEENTIIEGQICVRERLKGKGLAELLHTNFLGLLKGKYTFIVTEIAAENGRSVAAHVDKLGLKIVQTYSDNGKEWHILVQRV